MNTLSPLTLVRIFLLSVFFTFVTHPGLWSGLVNGYPGDYLFNLSGPQIIGLIFITSLFAIVLFLGCMLSSYLLARWLQKKLAHWVVILISIVLALLLCAIALLVVPQLHYQYYRLILPDLPMQWVPLGDLSSATLWQYLLLSADATTTVHAKGATVWVCVFGSALVAYDAGRSATD